MLLQRMELLLGKTNDDDVRQHVLPLIYNALDSDMAKVQVGVHITLCCSILVLSRNCAWASYPQLAVW